MAVTQTGLLKALALILIVLLPMNVGWTVWRVLDYKDRHDSIMSASGVLWAHNPGLHDQVVEQAGYRVDCPGGCWAPDQRRIRQCVENAWIVEHYQTWESARGYFLRCIEGEGYVAVGCSADEPGCALIGKPSLWDPWGIVPERDEQKPEEEPEEEKEKKSSGQVV